MTFRRTWLDGKTVNPQIAIVASIVCFALAILALSTLRPAKSRLKSTSTPYRPMRSRIERLAAIAAEINAYLLVLAIGLGTLDVTALAILRLPEVAVLDASSAGVVVSAADPKVATETVWSAP
jgi:cytochrome b561